MYRFEEELKLIVDKDIQNFTRKCLGLAPAYFWEMPASMTGRHHPKDELVKGGQVLHVRKMVKVAEDLCLMYAVTPYERDCVLSAAIMHDLCKCGYPDQMPHTLSGHGPLWIKVGEQVATQKQFMETPYLHLIAKLISCHMGRFDIPFLNSDDQLINIIQISDYLVSRKYVKISLSENGD